jgi:MurNAc alpha-1-phosphate uridylyltransferase
MIRRAMALAAGLGLRLRPITDARPKPLVEVGGRAMLDHALDRLEAAGIEDCVVNLHHLGAMIRAHLAGRVRPRILFSDESDARLETGGGVAKALPLLGRDPFFVVNADIVWFDGPQGSALARLTGLWDDARLDALLLLTPRATAFGYEGPGDFRLDDRGRPSRRGEAAEAPYVFAGVQILSPRLFAAAPPGAFSLNLLYDRALARGRLGAALHDGRWFHVGTPQALADANAILDQPA